MYFQCGVVCEENCGKEGGYDPADTESELRWCVSCKKWFHTDCIEREDDLGEAEDRGQGYILLTEESVWCKIISQPIRRVSRKHKAPLSLEKVQRHLIRKWNSGEVLRDEKMLEEVRECDLFGGEIPENFLEVIEDVLVLMGVGRWMRCPTCLSRYI